MSEETIVQPDGLEELLDRAKATPFTRAAVEKLAPSAPIALLRSAFECALDARGPDTARTLGFALAAAGGSLPYAPLAQLVRESGILLTYMPLIAVVEGDPVELVLDAGEACPITHERWALTLVVTFDLAGRKPPPRLIGALRSVAREHLTLETGHLVGAVAQLAGDPALLQLSRRLLPPLPREELEAMLAETTELFLSAPLRTVPEKELPRGFGHTVVRSTPRLGRNDPCPCGSGRKYKKCCAEKTEQASAQVSLLEQFERLGDEHRQVRNQIFDRLLPAELARVDLQRLTTTQIIDAMRRLSRSRRWRDAERFAETLKSREDVPGGTKYAPEYHWEIAMEAFEAGAIEVAAHHFELSEPAAEDRPEIACDLALARRAPDALEHAEARALSALRDADQGALIGLAHTLLRTHPALGIMLARAAIDVDRDLDSEMLLMEVERTRDRLLLPPEEPWSRIYRLLLAHREERETLLDAWESDDREREALNNQVSELRRELRRAGEQARDLAKELQARRGELDRLAKEREELSSIVTASLGGERPGGLAELESERRRLREKIDALEAQISAGNAQRAEMRRQLSLLAARKPEEPQASPEAEPPEEVELDEEVGPPRFVLVPSFSSGAAKTLAALPRHVAAQALRIASALAAGEEHEWKGVKRMRSTEDVHSARVGRSHRLLFRFGGGEMQVLDVTDRKDLDAAIARSRD
jgi:hypothetical protein